MGEDTCSVEDCGRKALLRSWCKTHYDRWRATGEATGPIEDRHLNRGTLCAVSECGRAARARGWCNPHYQQWRLGGEPTGLLVSPRDRRETCGYFAAHLRLSEDRGPASTHACVDCGGQAAEWSYGHNDPDELYDPTYGMAFSLDQGHYSPRCKRCHIRFDRRDRKADPHARHRRAADAG